MEFTEECYKLCNCTLGGHIGCYSCLIYIKHCGGNKPSYEEFLRRIEEKNISYSKNGCSKRMID